MRDAPATCLDFGTSKTLIASGDYVVPLGELHRWMPSLVGLADDASILVGEDAESADPEKRIRSIKRAITKRWNEIRDSALARVRRVSADELIVAVLHTAAARAGAEGGTLRPPATLTVACPAIWDSGQRLRFLRLLDAAGIPASPADLVGEPVAAGIAWLEQQSHPAATPMRILVFDMGGGTLDVAVIDVRGPDDSDVYVLAAVGRAEAGDSLDEAIADDLAEDLEIAGLSVTDPDDARRRRDLLLDAARRLKVRLTTEDEAAAVLRRDLFGTTNEVWYQRTRLEAAFAPQMERAVELVLVALRIAHLTTAAPDVPPGGWPPPDQLLAGVDVVLLAGGMSRVPYVTQRLRQLFGPTPTISLAFDPPEEAVVRGLASATRYRPNVRYALDYDIVLEWGDGQRSCSLYEAYMPIIESWWIERNWQGELRFLCTGRNLDLPIEGKGVLRVTGTAQPVAATLNGASLDGYPVVLNGDAFELAIYPSGRLTMTDGAGIHVGRTRG